MKKLKKKFGKLNSVEAYDCICWMSLASCACNCICVCHPDGIHDSNQNVGSEAVAENQTAYLQYQSNNSN